MGCWGVVGVGGEMVGSLWKKVGIWWVGGGGWILSMVPGSLTYLSHFRFVSSNPGTSTASCSLMTYLLYTC